MMSNKQEMQFSAHILESRNTLLRILRNAEMIVTPKSDYQTSVPLHGTNQRTIAKFPIIT